MKYSPLPRPYVAVLIPRSLFIVTAEPVGQGKQAGQHV